MKYEKYKPSGFNWIGDVPEHWEMKRFRYCFKNGKGLSITKEDLLEKGVPCVSYGEIHSKFGFKIDPEKDELLCVDEKYLETNQSSVLSDGDFVFADTSEDIDGSGNFTHLVGNHKIFAGYHTIVSRLKINAIPRYIAYFFDSVAYRTQIRSEVQGVKVYSITNKILKDTILLLPELNEQQTIASYLDEQTQRIDRLISNKKAQAEKLKELRQIEINNAVTKGLNPNAEMKDSSIEWLGQIPKHWEVKRLKDLVNRIGDGIHSTPSYVDVSEIYFVNGNNLIGGEIKIFENTDCIDEQEYLKYRLDFNIGTLLISINGTIGNLAFYKGEKIVLGKSAAYIDFTSKLHNFFLYYFLQSYMVSNIFELSFSGTTIKNLSLFTLRNLRVFLPPKEEQIEIASYLQQRTTAIDQLIGNIEHQLEQLQELRKIKIYEAVTGKIKVNAYAEATA